MNIILIGMPGCGKSTVGVILAKVMGMQFCDTDILLQQRKNKKLQEIIDTEGNDAFLAHESDTLLSLSLTNTVIATGGSAIYSHTAMLHLRSMGKVVYLKVSEKEIERRLADFAARGVAIKDGMTVSDLYKERTPLYKKYADIIVDADTDIPSVIAQIKAKI